MHNDNKLPERKYLRRNLAFQTTFATHLTSVAPVFKERFPKVFTADVIKELQSGSANYRATSIRRVNAKDFAEALSQKLNLILLGEHGTYVELEPKAQLPDLAPEAKVLVPAGWLWQCVEIADTLRADPACMADDQRELQIEDLPPLAEYEYVPEVEFYLDANRPMVKWSRHGNKALGVQYRVIGTEHWQGTVVVMGTTAPLALPQGGKPVTYELCPVYMLNDQPHGQYGAIQTFTVPAL